MLHTLKQYFGYDSFREGQEDIISSVLSGNDCLCVMPTGAGKSICFQVPALMMKGITLVISPLISLMKDQVNALTQEGVKAAYINSSLTERQVDMALANARNGMYKIIYIAPERLEGSSFARFAAQADVSMVTVDEAHCVSQWGQDFRPSYLKVALFIKSLPKRPVVSAFTATATPVVQDDIANLLELIKPHILVTGFDRKNLFFSVQKPVKKFDALVEFLREDKTRPGIIYCATRKTVENVCLKLNRAGYKAVRYHGGLTAEERSKNQEEFLYDRVPVMVATNAFGMGIDKSNVRYVIHYNMPPDIESYYQEAGRAGRDGEKADCLLFFSVADVKTNEFLIDNSEGRTYPDQETERVLKERDRRRLRLMTQFCYMDSCLREYILKYFGENPKEKCDNCSNCDGEFEMRDVTLEAQKILSCVIKSGERYGASLIIDVLRGSKSKKVMGFGLDRLSTYNISSVPEERLKDIVQFMIMNKYLFATEGKYSTLRRGLRAKELLGPGASALMKVVKGNETPIKIRAGSSALQPVNKALFDKLKEIRTAIANEQNVPAFVIFHDSTLTDICMKMPRNDAEFKAVSGVGQVKLERYGKRFMDAISEFADGGNADALNDIQAEPITAKSIETSDEPVTISVVADRINCFLIQNQEKKISGAKINKWLISKGYMAEIAIGASDRYQRRATRLGRVLGIIEEEKTGPSGEVYYANLFGKDIQRYIINNLQELLFYS